MSSLLRETFRTSTRSSQVPEVAWSPALNVSQLTSTSPPDCSVPPTGAIDRLRTTRSGPGSTPSPARMIFAVGGTGWALKV